MKQRSKRKTLAIITALCLSTFALSKTETTKAVFSNSKTTSILESNKKRILIILETIIKNNPNFQQNMDFYPSNEKASTYYCNYLLPFFEEYEEYLTLEQVEKLFTAFYKADHVLYRNDLIELFYNMMQGEEKKINGISHAYAEMVIQDTYLERYPCTERGSNTVTFTRDLFRELVLSLPEKEVASYILTNDMEGLKEALRKYYHLESMEEIDRLFDLYDKYYNHFQWKWDDVAVPFTEEYDYFLHVALDIIDIQSNFLSSKLENESKAKVDVASIKSEEIRFIKKPSDS